MPHQGALKGKFTVDAKGRKVQFSEGNLMYHPRTKRLTFALNQYDYIGNDRWGTKSDGNNENVSSDYDGWIDLFAWGTGNDLTKKTGEAAVDYCAFVDWGNNAILGGGNTPSQWRTLTKNEMNYILNERPDAHLLCGKAVINGRIYGFVLLPDNWSDPVEFRFDPFGENLFSWSDWSKMEERGAVFIPDAGVATQTYDGKVYYSPNFPGGIWLSTPGFDRRDAFVAERRGKEMILIPERRTERFSVRLVRDY